MRHAVPSFSPLELSAPASLGDIAKLLNSTTNGAPAIPKPSKTPSKSAPILRRPLSTAATKLQK